jgi:hypothetical protein
METHTPNKWTSNGARNIKFLRVGEYASTVSTTPCEDAGLLALTKFECEFAVGDVIPICDVTLTNSHQPFRHPRCITIFESFGVVLGRLFEQMVPSHPL